MNDEPKAGRTGAEAADQDASARAREPREASKEARDSRLPLERFATEFIKRGISASRDMGESILPKELASNVASQLVDARHGLVNAIAKEVGRFLRQADIASEVRKVLTGLNVEAKVQLRFSEDDKGILHSSMEVNEASASVSPPARKSDRPGSGGDDNT